MALYCTFNSRREASSTIGNTAKQRGIQLFERPWNFYEPDNTAWWLIPSTEWPAYRHGKFFFDEVEGHSNILLCGVYIEKGIGSELRGVYSSASGRRCIMQTDWAWFRLLHNFRHGKVEALITKLSNDINSPVEVQIESSYVSDPQSFDPYEVSLGHDSYRFELQRQSNALTLVESKITAHLSDILSNVGTISDLSGVLDELNKNPWLWVDVFIALQFHTLPPSDLALDDIWNSNAVWDRFLCNFLPWL